VFVPTRQIVGIAPAVELNKRDLRSEKSRLQSTPIKRAPPRTLAEHAAALDLELQSPVAAGQSLEKHRNGFF
jgi:hypothetical protein